MGVISATAFAVLLWGTLVAVSGVFCYELYAIGVEYGVIGRVAPGTTGENHGETK